VKLRLGILILFLLQAHPCFAAEEPNPNLASLDLRKNTLLYTAKGRFQREFGWRMLSTAPDRVVMPVLKDPKYVRISGSASVYSSPAYAKDPSSLPYYVSGSLSQSACELTEPQQGKLIAINNGIAAVQIKGGSSLCGGNLNYGLTDPDVAFVSVDSLTLMSDDSGVAEEKPCAECIKKNAIDALNDVGGVLSAEELKQYESTAPPVKANIKSDAELEHYLACYKTDFQDDYDKYYKTLIEDGAEVFQAVYDPKTKKVWSLKDYVAQFKNGEDPDFKTPFVVAPSEKGMKCLVRRESNWDRNERSPTGAVGLGMQVESNVEDLSKLLHGYTEKIKIVNKKTKKVTWKTRQIPPATWATSMWNNYFAAEKKKFSAAAWKKLNTRPNGTRCRQEFRDKDLDAVCPVNSLAAAYLSQVVSGMDLRRETYETLKPGTDYSDDKILDKDVATLGTHNAGRTDGWKAAKKVKDVNKWENAIVARQKGDRVEEVKNYMEIMRNCLEKDNWGPLEKADEKDKKRQKDLEAQEARCAEGAKKLKATK
jgi:hypothetical protein